MARDTRVIATCDPCDYDEVDDVPAVTSHRISIDGAPEKELDFCVRDALTFRELQAVCEKLGRTVEPKVLPAKQLPRAAQQASSPESAEDEVDYRTAEIICPLPHNREGGLPQRILVGNRGSHCKDVHGGLKMWEVVWGDPDRVLSVPCRAHAQCITFGLSFISKKGLGQHTRNCDLPRIDREDEPADMRQEGDPQKHDELA